MTILITGRNMEVKQSTRAYVERRLRRLEKISRRFSGVEVILNQIGEAYEAEMRVRADKGEFFATHGGNFLRSTIDQCIDKLERQMNRHIGKLQDRRRRASVVDSAVAELSADRA